MKKNYITPAGLQKLKEELHELNHGERPQVVATVAWAASNGDRSENADYIYGKRRLREIDRRIRFLVKQIEVAEVVDPAKIQSKTIVFGATVTVASEEGQERTYQIVGENELDPNNGKVSWRSPLARALMGKAEGDEALIQKPQGEESLEILKVRYK